MSGELDARLLRLKTELDDHARIARYLGLDFERPIQSLGDGYPENAIAWVGKITERLLKQLWRHHDVPGSPAGRTLKDLISGCRPHIRSHTVIEALRDIQRLRNRSAHDGYVVADEDGLTAVRRLLDILAWYTSTGSGALSGDAPRLAPAVASKAEFLAGLYVTLDFRLANRTELSQHTVYQLFVRERGLRTEYVELLLSKDVGEVDKVLEVTGGELLQTALPKLTRFLILEDDGGQVPELLLEDCRVVTYDHFMDTVVDLDRHIADIAGLYPRLDREMAPVAGDLLSADERSGEMRITEAGAAAELLEKVAASGGNLLIVGRPGTGKTTLLKQLVAAAPRAGTRRYRFFFDLSLKNGEPFAELVARTLAPYMSVETAYVYPVFCYETLDHSVIAATLLKQRSWIDAVLVECSNLRQREQILEIAGATAGVLGYIAVGRSDFPLARAYCLEAFLLGDFAEDARLQAWARGLQSFCEYYAGQYEDALDFAQDGLRYAESGPQSIRLTINGVARALGKIGDAEGVHRAVGVAYELMSLNDAPGGVPSSISFDCYSEAQTASNAATAYVSLGISDKVQHYINLALPEINRSGSPWSRSLVMIDLAFSLVRSGRPDLEQGTKLILEALEISAGRSIVSVHQRTGEFLKFVGDRFGHVRQIDTIREAAFAKAAR